MSVDQAEACDLLIRNAELLDGEGSVDIAIADGGHPVDRAEDRRRRPCAQIDAAGGLVTTSFIDPHFHLDKVLSRGLFGAVSLSGGVQQARDVKKHFTVADVESRVMPGARSRGRTGHRPDQDQRRCRLRDAADLDGRRASRSRPFPRSDRYRSHRLPAGRHRHRSRGAWVSSAKRSTWGPISSAACRSSNAPSRISAPMSGTVFDIAEEKAVPLDFHCDYTDLPEFKTLEMVADMTDRARHAGQGHRRPLLRARRLSRRRGEARHRQGQGRRDHR